MHEPESVLTLRKWLRANGGEFNQDARYNQDDFGYRVVASKNIPADTVIASCPADLIITSESSRKCIFKILANVSNLDEKTLHWAERQWIATYLSLHWIIDKHDMLKHLHYLNTLPNSEKLRTSLYFSSSELALFQGSNLYGATIDRQQNWRKEWESCQSIVAEGDAEWGEAFTWRIFLNAATYITSRGFTSSLLPQPVEGSSAYPILIPGVDSLNHARAHPVSWITSFENKDSPNNLNYSVALVSHVAVSQDQEIFNNYGPKPNAELILGYGFSFPHNPDDTIFLKIGGFEGQKWEIGREARNAEGLWLEVLSNFVVTDGVEPTYEDILDAAGSLLEMTEQLLQRLPRQSIPESQTARPEVAEMFQNYIDGQRDILVSLLDFIHEREQEAVDMARQNGIELILE